MHTKVDAILQCRWEITKHAYFLEGMQLFIQLKRKVKYYIWLRWDCIKIIGGYKPIESNIFDLYVSNSGFNILPKLTLRIWGLTVVFNLTRNDQVTALVVFSGLSQFFCRVSQRLFLSWDVFSRWWLEGQPTFQIHLLMEGFVWWTIKNL